MTASWLAVATEVTARDHKIPPQYFMPNAFPVTTIPLHPAWDPPTVCWTAHSYHILTLEAN